MILFEAEVFKVFALVMVRFSGLFISAPILNSANFPAPGKAAFAAMLAFMVTPVIPAQAEPLPGEALAFGLLAVSELLIGLILGFVMNLIFAAVQVAGQVMDMLSGFAMVNVLNPAFEAQVPIFGFFLFILAALFLFVSGGHHVMIYGLWSTFDQIPLGGLVVRPDLLHDITALGRIMFVQGLLIAAPIGSAMLLTYASLGLLGRVVPQMHVIVVGFPLTIAFALLLMGFMVGFVLMMLDGMFDDMFRNMSRMIPMMS